MQEFQLEKLFKSLAYFRWNFKPIRWLGKFARAVRSFKFKNDKYFFHQNSIKQSNKSQLVSSLRDNAYVMLDSPVDLPSITLDNFNDYNFKGGQSFYDVKGKYWEDIKNYVTQVFLDETFTTLICSHFKKEPRLWNIALNLSRPTDGLLDSQYWHFDYGDTQQLHFMIYFSNIDNESGPFTFLPLKESLKIPRSFFMIERFSDSNLTKHGTSVDSAVRATGKRGDIYIADPGKLMHQGARCQKDRLVLFISITTQSPMSKAKDSTIDDDLRKSLLDSYNASNGNLLSKNFFIN